MKIQRLGLVVLAVGLGLFSSFIHLEFFESYFFDLLVRWSPTHSVSNHIEIVLFDTKTVEALKGLPQFPDHEVLLRKLIKEKPKAIVYITPLVKMGQTEVDVSRSLASPNPVLKEMLSFAKVASTYNSIYAFTDKMFLKGEEFNTYLDPNLKSIKLISAPMTADTFFSKDGVTRRVLIDYQGQFLGHVQMAQFFNPMLSSVNNMRGVLSAFDTHQVYIRYRRPGVSFSTSKFEDVLLDKFQNNRFKDKIVLIGDDIGRSLKSYVLTPYSREPGTFPLVEMHANMIETLINNEAPLRSPQWLDIILTIMMALLSVHVIFKVKPLKGIVILIGSLFGYFCLSYLAYWLFGIWFGMAAPFLILFITYYFFVPYRLILVHKHSWELFEKNQILSQVELLKTNFISMMSHDLKTPLARIQGMAEIIANEKEKNQLSESQENSLLIIQSSCTELLRFIESILLYAQLESKGLELQCQSADLNELILEVIRRNQFAASKKNIEILTELEPLFSLKLDPHLIKQVLSNIIENAIKYSPPSSKVLITSEELSKDWVRIQISDQGSGIPEEELPYLFMKFFRSKNAKYSEVKGSGLGLYLAKYFIELHQGRISAESLIGQGSTFTIELLKS